MCICCTYILSQSVVTYSQHDTKLRLISLRDLMTSVAVMSCVMINCTLFWKVPSDHPSVKQAEDLIIYSKIAGSQFDDHRQRRSVCIKFCAVLCSNGVRSPCAICSSVTRKVVPGLVVIALFYVCHRVTFTVWFSIQLS